MKSETEVLIEALDKGYNYFRNILKKGLEASNRYEEDKDFNEGFFDYLLKHPDELKFEWYRVTHPAFESEKTGKFMSTEEYNNNSAKDFETKCYTESFIKYLDRQKHKVKFNWKAVKSLAGFDQETKSTYTIKSRYVYQGEMYGHTIDKIYNKIIEDLNNENGSMFFIYELQVVPVLIEPDYVKVDKSKIRFLLKYAKQVLVPGEDYSV